MAKSEEEMKDLLENPDNLDMDDEDAILAMADDADVPEEATDQLETDLDEGGDKKPTDTNAGESDDADDKNKDAADKDKDLSDDDIKAPIQSKDGEHTIPYNVLENTRTSLKSANSSLATKETELEDQRTENARLQGIIDKAESGGDVDDDDLAAIDDKSTATTPEEEFLAKNGMDTEAFTKEYGKDLTNSLLAQAKESLDTRQQLAVLMEDRNRTAEAEEVELDNSLQGAIDAIPELAAIQAAGGEKWQEAVDTDNALKMMPKYKDSTMSERFTAVAKEMGLEIPKKADDSKENKNVNTDTDEDTNLPKSISDLPGGSAASQSDRQSVEDMDAADIGLMFADMTPKQQDEYLNKL